MSANLKTFSNSFPSLIISWKRLNQTTLFLFLLGVSAWFSTIFAYLYIVDFHRRSKNIQSEICIKSEEELIDKLKRVTEEHGLRINRLKTKVIIVDRDNNNRQVIIAASEVVDKIIFR